MEKTNRNAKSRYETKTADTRSTPENKCLQTEFDTAFNHIETAKRTLNYRSGTRNTGRSSPSGDEVRKNFRDLIP
jgi:hypothetical protein